MNFNKYRMIRAALTILLLAGCGGPAATTVLEAPTPDIEATVRAAIAATQAAQPTDTPTPKPTKTPSPTDTPKPTNTAIPTDTPKPTNTPIPTDTPKPTNIPIPTDTPKPIDTPTPEAGHALKFDGEDDYVDVATTAGFSSMSSMTFEAWVRLESLPPSGKRFGIAISGDAISCQDNFGVMVDEIGAIYTIIGTRNAPNCLEGPYTLTSSRTLQIGKWHHVAVTYDMATGTFAVYVDGLPAGVTTTDSSGFETRYHHFGFGRWNDGTGFPGENFHNLVPFRGEIDEVRIWNVARAGEAIQATMNTSLADDESGLVSYWSFNEGDGQIVYDATENHNDGRLGSSLAGDTSDPAWSLSVR
jgi:hypothetical protein